jgi:hypothetical protein
MRAVLSIALVSCSSSSTSEPVVEQSLAIVPAVVTLPAGTTRQFATTNLSGETLLWTSSDSAIVRVDQTGFVRAVRQGTVTISARTRGVPARVASASLTVEGSNPCLCGGPVQIGLSQLTDARNGTAVVLTAVHDSISVVATVTEWRLGSVLELAITGAKDTVLTRTVPADFFDGALAVGWNTGARVGGTLVFPNGDYRVSARLVNAGIATGAANSIPLTLANP